jgi:hypothetical protein
MFKFPVTIDNIADVPAEFAACYVKAEDGDSATLIDELKKQIVDGEGRQKALGVERKRADTAERALKDWKAKAGVETPDALAELISEKDSEHEAALAAARQGSGKDDADVAKRIDAAKEDLARKHSKEIDRLTGERDAALKKSDTMRASMEKNMREEAAVRAIAANKGNVRLLKPHIIANTRVQEEDGEYFLRVVDPEDNELRYDGDGKPMTVEGFVASLRGIDDFANAFEADGASGGGARTTKTLGKNPVKNPWSKDTFNLTDQMRINKENPAMAAALKAAAVR